MVLRSGGGGQREGRVGGGEDTLTAGCGVLWSTNRTGP